MQREFPHHEYHEAHQEGVAPPLVQNQEPPAGITDVPRILIVEDVAADALLMELELRRAGLECVTRRVETADELVRALRHFSPDVVLSDHALPQFGATGTLEIVRSHSPDTPVIVVTGGLDEETAVDYIKAGATDYVIKRHLERLAPAVMRALPL